MLSGIHCVNLESLLKELLPFSYATLRDLMVTLGMKKQVTMESSGQWLNSLPCLLPLFHWFSPKKK